MSEVLQIVKLNDAYTPYRASFLAAGLDLASVEDAFIESGERKLISTGLKIKLPSGCYGRIAPRSGLAYKKMIDVSAGVIDADYRGILHVLLVNNSNDVFEIKKGDRIAQLICEKIFYPTVEIVDTLDDTERGENGFGSTSVSVVEYAEEPDADVGEETDVDVGEDYPSEYASSYSNNNAGEASCSYSVTDGEFTDAAEYDYGETGEESLSLSIAGAVDNDNFDAETGESCAYSVTNEDDDDDSCIDVKRRRINYTTL